MITVEDPVEYYLPGVTQMPVHAKAGVTFAEHSGVSCVRTRTS